MDTINILGIKFNNVTLEESVSIAMDRISNNEKTMVVTPNSEIAYMCKSDDEILKIINSANIILPDGIGVIYASKILKNPLKEKVAGIEFSENLVKTMAKEQKSLYILGAKPEIARKACEKLALKYNGLKIAGYQDGYFKDINKVIEDINNSQADVLLVCLGAPKQEKFMYDNFEKLNVKLMCGIGGSADIFSGEAKRAPDFYVKYGLEWFYRLIKQPERIGRMMKLPLFLLVVLKEKMFKR